MSRASLRRAGMLYFAVTAVWSAGRLIPGAPAFEPNAGQFVSRGAGRQLSLLAGGEAVLRTPSGNLRMRLDGADANIRGTGTGAAAGTSNYYFGGDRKQWRSGVAAFAAVKFERVYPGIDLVYYGSGDAMEYDFVVEAGADPGRIALAFSGADEMSLDSEGNLVFRLGGQTVLHRKPRVYQGSGLNRREVAGRYLRTGVRRVCFSIGRYDRSLPLTIDPVISSGTYLGGPESDGAFATAVDSAGNIYVAGITSSAGSPFGTGYSGAGDAFVVKLNPGGTALLYATYLGGSGQDGALSIAVDAQGNAYLTGGTNSRDFPVTSGVLQPRFGGAGGDSFPPFSGPSGDGFVTKLDPRGAVIYSSYLGGSGADQGYAIAIDASGNAFVTGTTGSADFPVTAGAAQATRRGWPDAFIARVNASGTGLLYATYLGGGEENYGLGLAVDSFQNAYLTGITTSPNFPVTAGALQTRNTSRTAGFVAKVNTGGSLGYATYLGGNNVTYAYGVAVDATGSAYVTGATTSTDFRTTAGAYQWRGKPGAQGGDVFVARLAPSGGALLFSSRFGSNGPDFGRAIALDAAGDVYVTGSTAPYGNGRILDFPTTVDATQRCGSSNPSAFLVRMPPDGSSLKFSSYLGGSSGGSVARAVATGANGRVYVAGSTGATDFPVSEGAVQAKFGGGNPNFDSSNLFAFAGDAFLSQVDLAAASPFGLGCEANAASLAPNLISPGEIVTFFGSGVGPQSGVAAELDGAGRLPTTVADTRVLFDGVSAPLLFVRSDQVNAVAPFGLSGKSSTEVQIEVAGKRTRALTLPVAAAVPGIFTLDSSGSGQAAALNEDGTYNTPDNPARPESIVVLFATGAGRLDPIPEDGRVIQGTPPRTLPTTAFVGSCPAEVLYAGSAPGLIAGAIQVNLRIPTMAAPGLLCGQGSVPVVVRFGEAASQTTATISVR